MFVKFCIREKFVILMKNYISKITPFDRIVCDNIIEHYHGFAREDSQQGRIKIWSEKKYISPQVSTVRICVRVEDSPCIMKNYRLKSKILLTFVFAKISNFFLYPRCSVSKKIRKALGRTIQVPLL